MKRLITILVVLISIVSISFASTNTTIKNENITILDFAGNNKELLETQAIAHQMAECARALGYDEEHNIIKTAQKILYNAQNFDTKFSGLDNLKKVNFNAIIELKETK